MKLLCFRNLVSVSGSVRRDEREIVVGEMRRPRGAFYRNTKPSQSLRESHVTSYKWEPWDRGSYVGDLQAGPA